MFHALVPSGLRLAWDSSPASIGVTIGPEHLLAYQNLASQAMFGTRTLGVPLSTTFPQASAVALEPMNRVLRTGAVVDVPPREVGVPDQVGESLLMRYVLAPLGEPPQGVVITAVDVTAETRAERALARAQLLADISTRMTAAECPEAALHSLTEVMVPQIADLAALYLVTGPHSDPTNPTAPLPSPDVLTMSPLLQALGPMPPPPWRRDPTPWDASLRTGTAILIPIDQDTLPVLAPEPAGAAWLRSAAAHNIAVVPVVVAGNLSATMVLVTAGERAPFRESDLPFLEDVTARASMAIGHVLAARRQQDMARGLGEAIAHLTDLQVRLGFVPGHGQRDVDAWESHLQTFPAPAGLTVVGEVDASNAHRLRSALRAAISPAADGVFTVDLSGLDVIDVAGARSLLTGTSSYRTQGGVVRLRGARSQVDHVLRLVGVHAAPGVAMDPT